MWNPFSYSYTPIRNPILRAIVAVVFLPVQLVWFLVVEVGSRVTDRITSLVIDGKRK